MKMNELEPGMYKIQKATNGSVRPLRREMRTVHLLRVTGYGEKRLYFIDDDIYGEHPHRVANEYEVISKYDGVPQVGKARITIAFVDASGDEFTFTMSNAWSLRNVFDAMPWLKKAFGYVPRRKITP